MPLIRKKRSPYAPRRKPAILDWSAEQAAVDRNRLEVVRVDEEARTSMMNDRLRADPLNQLVERAHRNEQALGALRTELFQELDGLRALIHRSLEGDN